MLSRTFAADWRPGDHIMTWLKRHEGKTQELSNLVHDGWSWTDVGRAMAVAGIHYRSGEPMSAAILRKKASEARAAVRSRNAGPRGCYVFWQDLGLMEMDVSCSASQALPV